MSEHENGHPVVRAEQDRIATPRILLVAFASLLVFFIASVVTVQGMYRKRAELLPDGPPRWPAEIGDRKIGLLEQRLFSLAVEPKEEKRAQLERLRSWGWVDRRAGAVHMPIGEAMERVARGERP
ncbi:MAG TPA: hypothetical protein VMK42_21555 [Anaeromyxobacteraceae bacterium]|nr:hypothetical protein [Anaeromyxobacteraceae bacterium]